MNNQSRIAMDLSKHNIQGLMLYDLKNRLKAVESARSINRKVGEDMLSDFTAQDWLAHFCIVDHDVERQPRSGRPSELDDQPLSQLVKDDLYRQNVCQQKLWVYHMHQWLGT